MVNNTEMCGSEHVQTCRSLLEKQTADSGTPTASDARSCVVAISILIKQTISKADKPHLAHLDPERKPRANLYPIITSPTTAQSCQKIGTINL